MRERISLAALLVKVTASMHCAAKPSTCICHAIRCTNTRVLPLPAPAKTNRAFEGAVTACRWLSFKDSIIEVTSIIVLSLAHFVELCILFETLRWLNSPLLY